MDFVDELKGLGKRIEQLQEHISSEEATKTSFILPFFQMLGYDVFNPLEFMPEYTADVGTKKGEKVDYAIMKDGKPTIFIECKSCKDSLQKHDSQLFRYFGSNQSAKFAILTNGIIYRFYTDLDNSNVMDLSPFLELNMLDIKEAVVPEIKKFHKISFDPEELFSTASELRYTNQIKQLLANQAKEPDNGFVAYIMGEVYEGRRTEQAIQRFKETVRKAFNFYINDVLNEKLKTVMNNTNNVEEEVPKQPENEKANLVIDDAERDIHSLLKVLLLHEIDPSRICINKTASYCSYVVDGMVTKWICRVKLSESNSHLIINKGNRQEDKYPLESINDIITYEPNMTETLKRFV